MSGQSAKWPKTTAKVLACVPILDSLPPELLDTIFGFLDAGTLCTARLVSVQFRDAASRFLRSVELSVETLRSRPETTLNNFPNLRRVTVVDVKEDDLLMLARSPVGDAVTHVRAVEHLRPVPGRGRSAVNPDPLLPLPNLMSMALTCSHYRAFPFPDTLRELSLTTSIDLRITNLVTRLTNLTSLRIDVHYMRKPFQAVTALTALQRLEVWGGLSLIPFVAELTLLTHLQFQHSGSVVVSDLTHLACLSRLHRLVHLGVMHSGAKNVERQVLESVAGLTGLRSLGLDLRPWERPAFETACMTPFSQLTALKLGSYGRGLDASFLRRFNLEGLQELSLSLVSKLERDGVVALRQATGLTRLHLSTVPVCPGVGLKELGTAVPHMSRLRALSLEAPTTFSLTAIARLTELTNLEVWLRSTAVNLQACLGLGKLRVLRITVPSPPPSASDCVTPETVSAIAKLPELRLFYIRGTAGDLMPGVREWLHADRHARGWPPLELRVT